MSTNNNKRSGQRSGRRKTNAKPKSKGFGITGTVNLPYSVRPRDLIIKLTYSPTAVSSSGGGLIQLAAGDNPNGSGEWANCAGLFDSYRVDSMCVEYVPNLTLQGAANYVTPPLIVVYEPDSATVLGATYALYIGHDNMRMMELTKHWYYNVAKMPRISSAAAITGAYTIYEDGFMDTATPANISSIQALAVNATTSTNYGWYIIHWIVHFKSRQ